MLQRRPNRSTPRPRSMALGGMLAALAVVGGGTLVAVTAPADAPAGGILLVQNETAAAAQEMPLGTAVDLDLEPVVARAAGGTIPEGTTVQITGLPDGLTQNGWVISGTPTRAGEYDVLVTVSNSGVSRSQKVAIVVTEESGGATTPSVTPDPSAESDPSAAAASPETSDPSGTTDPSDPSATSEPSTQVEPTLSAAPGDRARAGAAGAAESETGTGDGLESDDDDNGVGASPDLCAALEGGQLDASSLAQLLPMAGGDDTASTGLVMVLVNAVVGLLPSVLGEGGSLEDLGSVGEVLCTLSPSLLGGQGDTDAPVGEGTGTGGPGAAAAQPVAPALLGLLTTGAGSLGE